MKGTNTFLDEIIGILAGMVITCSAGAVTIKDDPYEVFDFSQKMYDATEVRIMTVNDISDRCQQESHKRGFGGFPYKVHACSFWNEGGSRKCTIYLGKMTNMHQLGHEVRHCYQGSWHQ
jgi:hypothetical protein